MRHLLHISLLVMVAMLASCSVFKGKSDAEKVVSVEEMYNNGLDDLSKGSYDDAIETFEDLESTYPYSQWATKAQIMSAYASFKDQQYDDALLTLERFIKLHPGNKDIAYAYYLRGLSFYEQISDVTKDQSYTVFARSALKEVVARFPDTKYAQDAQLKLDLVTDHLAGKEVAVGRYYLKQNQTLAAINRFQKVIKEYDTTAYVPEALHRLVEGYLQLGVKQEAVKYAAVLGYNFPESKWYQRTYRLIEGKDHADDADKSGKWYDFRNWSGMSFKNKATSVEDAEANDQSEELINTIDPTVEEKTMGEKHGDEPVENISHERKGGLKEWFKSMKKPFVKD